MTDSHDISLQTKVTISVKKGVFVQKRVSCITSPETLTRNAMDSKFFQLAQSIPNPSVQLNPQPLSENAIRFSNYVEKCKPGVPCKHFLRDT